MDSYKRGATFFLLVVMACVWGGAVARAQTATPGEMERVCQNWLAYAMHQDGSWAGEPAPTIMAAQPLIADDGLLLAHCFSISPRGYVLVPILKELPPVKAYSEECDLDATQSAGPAQLLRDVLSHRLRLFIQMYGSLDATQPATGDVLFDRINRAQWECFAAEPEQFLATLQDGGLRGRTTVGPLLTTAWHQGAPYNNLCPLGDGGRCLVGCVATATAQIMRYHRWPPVGAGNHSYTWDGDQSCGGSGGGGVLSVDFSDLYDWAAMANDCPGGCTQGQQNALAELCDEVGVAFDMDYGVCSSSATTSDALAVLPTFFRYSNSINRQNRANHTAATWFQVIQGEINGARPILYRIFGHAIVCDGWQDTGGMNQYHMNYGWADSHTAWYTLDGLYCPWPGCDSDIEYLIRRISPAPASIVAWGLNDWGLRNVPAPNTNFVAIAGGGLHNLGLKADGSIVAWGDNSWGQCDVPAPNSGFVAVAAGGHSLGLKADGPIVAWGGNYDGQCDVPSPNGGFVAVAAGLRHSLGLKGDGSIVAWGYNYDMFGDYAGQCDVPSPNTGFVAVAGGGYFSLGLKADGSIVAWGDDGYGQCDVPSPNADFVAVAGGHDHTLGLKADGSIVAWGGNWLGQCDVPSPNTDFVAVAGGYGHSLGLRADGSIEAWGYNGHGECEVPAPDTGFVALAGGVYDSLGLRAYPGGDANGDGSVDLGDMNCDGTVDFGDINPFVLYLSNNDVWQETYPTCPPVNGDINGDGSVGFGDINPFVALLTGS